MPKLDRWGKRPWRSGAEHVTGQLRSADRDRRARPSPTAP
jgi:hypothetical protein